VERELAIPRIEEERRRLVELRALAAQRQHVADPESYEMMDLPTQRAPVVRLPQRRRAQFRANLESVVERVRRGEADGIAMPKVAANTYWRNTPPHAVSAATQQTVVRACTLCKGKCCTGGSDHAWIDVATMRRRIASNPDASTAEIIEPYMAAIGSRTYRDSCIYHGPVGCTLSRELRADICNNYFCEPVARLRCDAPEAESVKAFLVVRDADGRQRGRFVVERGERQVLQ
jgi:hypothetical protein